jgi:hypothetical protein
MLRKTYSLENFQKLAVENEELYQLLVRLTAELAVAKSELDNLKEKPKLTKVK